MRSMIRNDRKCWAIYQKSLKPQHLNISMKSSLEYLSLQLLWWFKQCLNIQSTMMRRLQKINRRFQNLTHLRSECITLFLNYWSWLKLYFQSEMINLSWNSHSSCSILHHYSTNKARRSSELESYSILKYLKSSLSSRNLNHRTHWLAGKSLRRPPWLKTQCAPLLKELITLMKESLKLLIHTTKATMQSVKAWSSQEHQQSVSNLINDPKQTQDTVMIISIWSLKTQITTSIKSFRLISRSMEILSNSTKHQSSYLETQLESFLRLNLTSKEEVHSKNGSQINQ